MKTIFKLEKCYLKEHCRMREHGFIRPAGYLDLGFFSSRKKAEKFMRQYIADTCDPNTFAFFIFEDMVDGVRYSTRFACKSRYSYTADGKLNDYSDVSTNGKARYYGRTPDRIRFQPGDIVEVTDYDGIELCIVAAPPRTVEECQAMMECCREHLRKYLHREPTPQEVAADYPLDDTDDTYCVLQHYGDGAHEHLPPISLFKPTRRITKAQRELLLSLKQK
ncbi:MAG: hypothetical protein J5730_00825 [Bacteroidales bacterium]|nr:hypothetical protein [Bacteroidales bacterium]